MVAAAAYNGPVYLRLSRANVPDVYQASVSFEIGKAVELSSGKDVALIATGYMVQKALEAAELLKNKGIHATVLDMHTIKPLDYEAIVTVAKRCGAVVVCEEHSTTCGLGSQ